MRKRLISVCIVVILAHGIYGCAQTAECTLSAETVEKEYADTEEAEAMTDVSEQEEQTEAEQRQWQVCIQPDMPEPYIEVLKQYEDFMNADVQDINDDDVRRKFNINDGKWRYLYDELCGSLMSLLKDSAEESDVEAYRYSLTDLTGDGFPELIMGRHSDYFNENWLYVVYYYSETRKIKMEFASSYFSMTLYEGSIIEYISAGVNYTITYLQFQKETESWEQVACIIVDWDSQSDSENYYWGVNLANFDDPANEPMTEEEYQEIIERYTTKPVELEWTPMFLGEESASGYFFPQGETSHMYLATFENLEPEEKEVALHITEVQVFEEGILYELKIDSDVEAWETYAGHSEDWRNFGLFYVQGDEIYFIRAEDAQREYQTVEEILKAGTLVCNEAGKEDVLDENEVGRHEFIESHQGDIRCYRSWSITNEYNLEGRNCLQFIWKKEIGLIGYKYSRTPAGADSIRMWNPEYLALYDVHFDIDK